MTAALGTGLMITAAALCAQTTVSNLGEERSLVWHLSDSDAHSRPLGEFLAHGERLFAAKWTEQDGGGRPLSKGTGRPLADLTQPLTGARGFNRVSAPDANSCSGCHNVPYFGGGGDFVTSVFVLGQRFDHVTFDPADKVPTRGTVTEEGKPATLQTVANLRATTGMFGAGYLEMLAREITNDLQRIRDSVKAGETKGLASKGVEFGSITLRRDGLWDVSKVKGLPRLSLLSGGSHDPPSLIVRPWHQAANVTSLREFTNNAFNHHHGIQSVERFGEGTDPDGDGVANELTKGDVTAVVLYQAVLAVPGRVIPNDAEIEEAVANGEKVFEVSGCAECHRPALPLSRAGAAFVEPGPYNAPGSLRSGELRDVKVDLNDPGLPGPRLSADRDGVTWVPAFTDFRVHDITDPDDPEPLDMNWGTWSKGFQQGNRQFLTKRLWGFYNEAPYFHHGLYMTARQAILAHAGEAKESRRKFQDAAKYDQDSLIEFLKTLQVLPPGTKDLIVDEHFRKKNWSAPRTH